VASRVVLSSIELVSYFGIMLAIMFQFQAFTVIKYNLVYNLPV
jgi:hypothetical protein